jgi:hypothetical protein
MSLPLKLIMLVLALSALGLGTSIAGEKVCVSLYVGENAPLPPGSQPAPGRLHHQLEQVFGFQHYRLLKEQDFFLRNEWEQWFMPRRDFFMRLEPLHREFGQPKMLDYEIYKDGFIVVKGTYELHAETPLFINGPDFHQGRLILVLEAP